MVIHLIGAISLQPKVTVTIISETNEKQTDHKTDEADEEDTEPRKTMFSIPTLSHESHTNHFTFSNHAMSRALI